MAPITLYALVPLLIAMAMAPVYGAKIGSPEEFPGGTLGFTVQKDGQAHSLGIKWGGETANTGRSGPVLSLRSKGSKEPTYRKINQELVGRLFENARKLAAVHTLSRTSTGDRSNRSYFQLSIGHMSDPVSLNFPANEPHLWNRAAGCWQACIKLLNEERATTLPAIAPLDTAEREPPALGIASIGDYSGMEMRITRTHRTKLDYGVITAKWTRSDDGKITFFARYTNRAAQRLRATPSTKEIRSSFSQLQKLFKGYQHPSFASAKKLSRNYDTLDVQVTPTGQPGTCLLPFFSSDSSQWGSANQLWSVLIKLFPEEDQPKILR